jgi:hypothetical protein
VIGTRVVPEHVEAGQAGKPEDGLVLRFDPFEKRERCVGLAQNAE